MLVQNVRNDFLYVKNARNVSNDFSIESIDHVLKMINVNTFNYIKDINIINDCTLINSSKLSLSLTNSSMLGLKNIDHELKDTGRFSVFSELKYPFIYRKTFNVAHKDKAIKFFKALLKLGQVTMTTTNSLALDAVRYLDNLNQFDESWVKLAKKSRVITIEQSQRGDAFKIFIHGAEILGVYGVVPAYVVGDGDQTLGALISSLSIWRSKNILYKNNPLLKIKKDLDLSVTPMRGEVVKLKDSLQTKYGSMYFDLTDLVKDKFQRLGDHLNGLLVSNHFLEVDCFSEDINNGIDDPSFIISAFRQSKADLKDFFSSISNSEKVAQYALKLFPKSDFDRSIKSVPSFINPEIYNNSHLKKTNQIYTLKESAYQLGLIVRELDKGCIQIINPETNQKCFFMGGMSQNTTVAAREVTKDKFLTKRILEKFNINTPKGLVFSIDALEDAWSKVELHCRNGGRLVLKPLDREGGKGVSTDITTKLEFDKAWGICEVMRSKKILVEEQLQGDDYRIVVIQNNVCAVSQRVAAHVIGDGQNTISALVDQKNQQRKHNVFLKGYPIKITDTTDTFLLKRGLTSESIPAKGEKVQLSEVANAGAGGDIIDRTDDIHPDWIPISVKAREIMADAYHVGLDIMMEDIAKSPDAQKWAIIEINTNPDFGVQLFPSKGYPRNIGKIFLESIFKDIKINKINYKLNIKGQVQGVGFRQWFKDICDFRSITGYVRNKDSLNCLEAIITGPQSMLEDIILKSYSGPAGAKVDTITWDLINDNELRDQKNSFEILI